MKVRGYQADHFGCGYYRMELPAREYAKNGMQWDNFDIIENSHFNAEYPVTVLQRQYLSKPLVGYFKARKEGSAMVYELDDWVWNIDNTNPSAEEYANPETRAGIEKHMSLVDAVTVSTDHLGKLMQRWIEPERIFTVPNCLNFEVWGKHLADRELNKANDGLIRIGWHGSATHLHDFFYVVKPLVRLLKEYKKLRLVICGWEVQNIYPELQAVKNQIEFHDWAETETFGRYLRDVDIGIAPLAYTEFNRAKSAIKHYEYSAMKIPTVATWIEPYHEVKARGGVSLSGNLEGEWYKALKGLIQNKSLRNLMGETAYQHVIRENNIESGFERWRLAHEMAVEIRKNRTLELYIGDGDDDPNKKLVDRA